MTTVQIKNVSPLGELEVPILGRNIERDAVVDVDAEIAGTAPDPTVDGDLGTGLLAQVGTWAPVVAVSQLSKKSITPPPADTTPPVVEGAIL